MDDDLIFGGHELGEPFLEQRFVAVPVALGQMADETRIELSDAIEAFTDDLRDRSVARDKVASLGIASLLAKIPGEHLPLRW